MAPPRTTRHTSAPGKVLLFGEHAVVHGTPAIACALDIGIDVEWVDDGDPLRLAFRGTPEETSGQGDHTRTTGGDSGSVGIEEDHPIAQAIRAIVAELGMDRMPTGVVTATSSLPAGAGLGSSAALCVALTCLLAQHSGRSLDEAETLRVALAGENVFHGNASGLDPAASINGGLISFRRGTPPEVTPLIPGAMLNIVVAQVEAGANTRRMVENVTARLERLQSAGIHLLGSIADLTTAAAESIHTGDEETLGELMDVNHGLLCALGTSTPRLDASCHAARSAGALGAKLTGAGGGGCVIALAPANRVEKIERAMTPHARFLRTITLPAGHVST